MSRLSSWGRTVMVTDTKRVFYLILIMTVVGVVTSGVAITMLYLAAFEQGRARLIETAQSRARLIESVARFDAIYSNDYSKGPVEATLSQVTEAHSNFKGFGETGEFALARLEGNRIVFLLSHRHHSHSNLKPIPFDSEKAEPMRAALSGKSGSMVGLDYRGVMVLAAHEPVDVLDLGIVAKIDLSEVRAPFVKAAAASGAAGGCILIIGALLFLRITNPMIRSLREYSGSLERMVEERTGQLEEINKALTEENAERKRVERELNEHQDKLESTVETRTLSLKEEINERKSVEAALRIEKNKLEAITGSIEAALCLLDSDLRLIWSNTIFDKWFGPDTQGPGSHCERFYKVKCQELECGSYSARKSGLVEQSEFIMTRVDGEQRAFQIIATPIKDASGVVSEIVELVLDITERKRTDDELRKMEKLESVGVLAGGIAHDFNNIMAAIVVNVGVAKTYLDPSDELYEVLEAAEKSALKGRALSNQLITFSSGGIHAKRVINIQGLLVETANLTLSGSNYLLQLDIQDDLWPVEVDEAQLGQVVHNLVLNGSQFMPGGSTVAVLAENVELQPNSAKLLSMHIKEGRYVKVSVKDKGNGIPDSIRDKIFDPYFSTRGLGSEKGNGLGLAIVHSIIKEHGGYIGFDTVTGEGSTFYFYLPASDKEPALIEPVVQVAKPKGIRRVLILEDDETVYGYLPDLLGRLGYEAAVAVEGTEAVRLYKEAMDEGRPFDVAIIDLVIRGGMGGKRAMERLLKIDPGITALVSSGYAVDPAVLEYEKYGFKGTLIKPYTAEALKATLHKFLGKDE